MSQVENNCKSDGRDPAVIARVIETRADLRQLRDRLERAVADTEARHTEAYDGRGSRLEFADQARRACEAADAYRLALRLHVVALIALLDERDRGAA